MKVINMLKTNQSEPEILLTVAEAAILLKTTTKAIYTMHERRQIPGAVKIRNRLLFIKDTLTSWIYSCVLATRGDSNECNSEKE